MSENGTGFGFRHQKPDEIDAEKAMQRVGHLQGKVADFQRGKNCVRDIDENLKRVYEDSLKEEIPDRFRLLLDQLRAKEGEK